MAASAACSDSIDTIARNARDHEVFRLPAAAIGHGQGAGAVLLVRADLHRGNVSDQGACPADGCGTWTHAGGAGYESARAALARGRRQLGFRPICRILRGCDSTSLVGELSNVQLCDARAAGARGVESAGTRRCGSIFGHSMGGHGALVCALRNPSRTNRFPPSPRSSRLARPVGTKSVRRTISARTVKRGASTTPANWWRASRFPGPILIDQGAEKTHIWPSNCSPRGFQPPLGNQVSRSNSGCSRATTTATTSFKPLWPTTCDTTHSQLWQNDPRFDRRRISWAILAPRA